MFTGVRLRLARAVFLVGLLGLISFSGAAGASADPKPYPPPPPDRDRLRHPRTSVRATRAPVRVTATPSSRWRTARPRTLGRERLRTARQPRTAPSWCVPRATRPPILLHLRHWQCSPRPWWLSRCWPEVCSSSPSAAVSASERRLAWLPRPLVSLATCRRRRIGHCGVRIAAGSRRTNTALPDARHTLPSHPARRRPVDRGHRSSRPAAPAACSCRPRPIAHRCPFRAGREARRLAAAVRTETTDAHELVSGPAWWVGANLPFVGTPLASTRAVAGAVHIVGTKVVPAVAALTHQLPDPRRYAATQRWTRTLSRRCVLISTRRRVAGRAAVRTAQSASPSTWLSPVDRGRAADGRRIAAARRTAHRDPPGRRRRRADAGRGRPS